MAKFGDTPTTDLVGAVKFGDYPTTDDMPTGVRRGLISLKEYTSPDSASAMTLNVVLDATHTYLVRARGVFSSAGTASFDDGSTTMSLGTTTGQMYDTFVGYALYVPPTSGHRTLTLSGPGISGDATSPIQFSIEDVTP